MSSFPGNLDYKIHRAKKIRPFLGLFDCLKFVELQLAGYENEIHDPSGAFALTALTLTACGLSQKEMETAKKHFAEAAEQQCKCDKIKAQKDFSQNDYSACVREYEQRVKYMEAFFEVTKPSSGERAEAAKAGDAVTAACK